MVPRRWRFKRDDRIGGPWVFHFQKSFNFPINLQKSGQTSAGLILQVAVQ
jgi:hypothetical protein